MAYAILRVAKLKTAGNIGGVNAHINRTMNVPNADPDLIRYNSRAIGSADVLADVKARLEEAGITKPRKDAVLAVEHLMTASPEHFNFKVGKGAKGEKIITGNGQRWVDFMNASVEWLKERYGAKNVVNVTMHLDEQSPHIHAIVVPIDSKGKLNCKSFLGGREKLRDMQTSFAEKVAPQGLNRGIEGSKAQHQEVKAFYAQVNDYNRQPPALEIPFKVPEVKVEPPQKGILGFGGEDPAAKAEAESKRINEELKRAKDENQKKASNFLQNLHNLAVEGNAVKIKNRSLEGQIKGLGEQVKALENKNKNSQTLIKYLVEGKIGIEEIKKAIEMVPGKEDKRQNTIRELIKGVGIPVRQEEPSIKKKRGLGL